LPTRLVLEGPSEETHCLSVLKHEVSFLGLSAENLLNQLELTFAEQQIRLE